jgi:HSP20 family molecular chaperone IbpA
MHPQLIESMRDQVGMIYRALTGTELPDEPAAAAGEPEPPFEEVTRAFAQLEAWARNEPRVSERVPPFSFTPPLDAIVDHDDLVIEVAVPGIELSDVTVENAGDTLVISGIQRGHRGAAAGTYSHAEIPRGPFYRSYHLPFPIHGEPAVDLDQGVLRVRLKNSSAEASDEAPDAASTVAQ